MGKVMIFANSPQKLDSQHYSDAALLLQQQFYIKVPHL